MPRTVGSIIKQFVDLIAKGLHLFLHILKSVFKGAFRKIKNAKGQRFFILIDKISFFHVFLIWFLIVLSFGFIYHFFATSSSHLYYVTQGSVVTKLTDSIYFSFVAATTTGFGDIVPFGIFKLTAIFEVICGLMLLAIVTSKLVSIKQNVILDELYELSLNEKINRMRSSLLLFRHNITRIMSGIEEGLLRKVDIHNIYIYVATFEDSLNETIEFIEKSNKSGIIKSIKPVNLELLVNSILNSFEKIEELIEILNKHDIKWKNEKIIYHINNCIQLDEQLFKDLSKFPEVNVFNLKPRKQKVITAIRCELEGKTKPAQKQE